MTSGRVLIGVILGGKFENNNEQKKLKKFEGWNIALNAHNWENG